MSIRMPVPVPDDKRRRVGASLLRAVGLDDLVYENMTQYESAMARCALDRELLSMVRQRLLSSKDSSPLFDTGRWVGNLEAAFSKMVELDADWAVIRTLSWRIIRRRTTGCLGQNWTQIAGVVRTSSWRIIRGHGLQQLSEHRRGGSL